MKTLIDTISIIANVMTIIGISGLSIYGLLYKNRNIHGRRIFRIMSSALKLSIVTLLLIFVFRLSEIPYSLIFLMLKTNTDNLDAKFGIEIYHILSFIITLLFALPLFLSISSIIMTSSLYYPKYFIGILSGGKIKYDLSMYAQHTDLEIIKATYGSDIYKIDVTEELQALVENNMLNVIASNNIKSDPHPRVKKRLHVKYRIRNQDDEITVTEHNMLSIQ
jgi:hypothetical protein